MCTGKLRRLDIVHILQSFRIAWNSGIILFSHADINKCSLILTAEHSDRGKRKLLRKLVTGKSINRDNSSNVN